ncbi:MAG: polynucleotide kinase-phosphatase [Gaiellaceae bacterium]
MKITVPELSLVLLIGPSGSGKSTFAANHFLPTEVLSSDFCRGLVSDDENDQAATNDAFEVLHFIAAKRLAAGRLTVVDATNVQPEARKPLVALAREYDVLPTAIVFNLPERLCQDRNRGRPDRDFGAHVIRRQSEQLRRSLKYLSKEGFRHIAVLRSPGDVEAAAVERQPTWTNRRTEHGPFDIIGDVHGCFAELIGLLRELGWDVSEDGLTAQHPEGRRAVFLGDLVDRGPDVPAVLRLVLSMVEAGVALCVPGNHDIKLVRALRGRDVKLAHGLAESLSQLEGEPPEFKERAAEFLDKLISHFVLDDGNLVVAHAGMRERFQGRASRRVRDFALFGETTGETDEFGLRVRYDWAQEYRGHAIVVYGHTPVPEAVWVNGTINIDTGCVFGGHLTALRYPERELVAVPARETYYEPLKPLAAAEPEQAPDRDGGILDIEDVLGKRIVETRLHGKVTIREENATAALEVMSRWALDPRWLIYLPPTMSPSETSQVDGLLEHPAEALAYYRKQGIEQVVCEEKHMGSRAIFIICRDEAAARVHFDASDGEIGVCYTRTGRRFFEKGALEAEVLVRLHAAIGSAGWWEAFETDWVCLDAEVMPWSAKAQELLKEQYAAVGAAATAAVPAAIGALERAEQRGVSSDGVFDRFRAREERAAAFVEAYRRYSWMVESVDDIRVAPFHLLASSSKTYVDQDHVWHMQTLRQLAEADPKLFIATAFTEVQLADPASEEQATAWWEEMTARGGEGMVVKPKEFIARGKRGLVQPAVKCRGSEYLRIIYGPDYTAPENLERLRERGLGTKRSMALREFALGIESLERFTRGDPLYRVHECAFGVLALESEPVDPRL